MATLVGPDGTGWTTTATLFGSSGAEAFWVNAGYTPVSDGTATTAYVYIESWETTTSAKVLVYRASDRVLLAQSADISDAGGVGLRSASITYSPAVATPVILAVLPNTGYLQLRTNNAGSTYATYLDAMTYASPDDPLPAGTNTAPREFIIYLDGTASGGSVTGRARNYYAQS